MGITPQGTIVEMEGCNLTEAEMLMASRGRIPRTLYLCNYEESSLNINMSCGLVRRAC